MKVGGVAVGPLDLAGGTELLLTSHKKGFPWLSANLLEQKGRPIVAPSRTIKAGALNVTLIGLTGAASTPSPGLSIARWQDVLPALIKKHKGKQDILILLSTLSPVENEDIAGQFPEIHLIVTSNLDGGNRNPQQINNSLLTQTDRQGKYLGQLTINWSKSGKWGKDRNETLSQLQNRLTALDWQLQRMRQQQEAQHPDYREKIRRVEENRVTVEQELNTLRQEEVSPAKDHSPPSHFTHQFIAMTRSIQESPAVNEIVTDLKRQINSLQQPPTSLTQPAENR